MTSKPPELDETVRAALHDVATVTSDGAPLQQRIDGVLTLAPANHVDHRGRVFEIFAGESEFWAKPVVYCYAFTVRTHQTKGWGLHEYKDDRYTLIAGEIVTLLFDARLESPTHGVFQEVRLSGQSVRQVLIPAGVWHLNINVAETETFLVNHPTAVYAHGRPDRLLLPWDSDAIPVDVANYFPNQLKGAPAGGGGHPKPSAG